ncbi:MAG: TDT family transporter [Eubacteriales bacterium]|nr:TDT family transporter [Eubacteriales bacterium]
MERLERIPVPVLPSFVGALTLSNVYAGMGYVWVRHLTMWAATILIVCYMIKIIKYPRTCLAEYRQVVPCSLYAAFPMILMILGSYYYDYVPVAGKAVWLGAICMDVLHILIFTYRNVIKERQIDTFVPCWYVTYNGIMVSCSVGGAMNMPGLLWCIVCYGIVIYFVILPFMIRRLCTVEMKPPVYHTMAVVLAPCSLCVVGYLNVAEHPRAALVYLLYGCVLASLLFVLIKLPAFFSFSFVPGFSGMTFPMAIGIVATNRMTTFLAEQGQEEFSRITAQISGIQIYVTTMIIGYVLLNLLMMALGTKRR